MQIIHVNGFLMIQNMEVIFIKFQSKSVLQRLYTFLSTLGYKYRKRSSQGDQLHDANIALWREIDHAQVNPYEQCINAPST